MTRFLTLALPVAAYLALTPAVDATGRLKCEATDRADWLSKAELTEKIAKDGWSVRFMKEDGGCWEVYGTTPEGQRVEAYFHPVSGKKLLVLRRGEVLFRAKQ